jgi:CIC family chloride channel protein
MKLPVLSREFLLVPSGRSIDARARRLLLDTIALGVAGAFFAQLFTTLLRWMDRLMLWGIAGYHPPGLPNEGGSPVEIIGPHGLWLVPVSTALGGLIVGLLAARFAPEAEGHGTDAVIRAFHRTDGEMRARIPFVKLIASAITIGSGGSAGREGPMALITGGIGSVYATVTGRTGEERRILLLVGMAAGLSAIFRSPIGAALLAVEILYADMEFEPGALLYTALGAIVAYAVNGMFVGWQPLFRFANMADQVPGTLDHGWYVLLGIAAGLLATVTPAIFYGTHQWFQRLPVKPFLKPAIGGLLMGLLAIAVPKVIGGGYGWMQQAIDGQLALGVLALLVVAKVVAMSLSVGSGGSGGVFAPTLFAGAMLGGAFAALAHLPPAPFVVVGMAAVFAGAAHVPIATMMMVTEMTGGYTLLVPATLAVILSYLVQRRLSRHVKFRSMYEAQVESSADSPAHHEHHLAIALQILRDRGFRDDSAEGERKLISKLRAGIPVELPGGRRLLVAGVRPDSQYLGKSLADVSIYLALSDSSILSVLRGEHMLAPRPDLLVDRGDRLILVSGANAAAALEQHFTLW